MKIVEKYSHLNGEEFLIVHHKSVYTQLLDVIESISAESHRTKKSKEKRKGKRMLYSPTKLNKAFYSQLSTQGWESVRYSYLVTTDRDLIQATAFLPLDEQRKEFAEAGIKDPIRSYKQTDFVKDKIAVEVQFGKYAFVAYDLFVKHMLFYSGRVINVGIEILPTRKMQEEMSSGIAYFEGEVYNVMRQGRSNPPVPLLLLGVEQED